MVKFIKILFFLFLITSCKTETIEIPKYMDADISFLTGSWAWHSSSFSFSTTGFGGYSGGSKDFIYKVNEPSIFCTLTFNENADCIINSSSGNDSKKLNLTGFVDLGEIKVITFRSANNELIRFNYNGNLNKLTTENTFFTFQPHGCNTGFQILTNTYEKQ